MENQDEPTTMMMMMNNKQKATTTMTTKKPKSSKKRRNNNNNSVNGGSGGGDNNIVDSDSSSSSSSKLVIDEREPKGSDNSRNSELIMHMPIWETKRRRCTFCKPPENRFPSTKCETCGKFLCLKSDRNCFRNYHITEYITGL